MGSGTQQVVEEVRVKTETFLLPPEVLQPLRRDGQQFGLEPAYRLGEAHRQATGAATAAGVIADARILVALHAGEHTYDFEPAPDGVDRLDGRWQPGARFTEAASQCLESAQSGIDLGKGQLPSIPVGENLLELPLVLGRDLRPFRGRLAAGSRVVGCSDHAVERSFR